MRDKNRTSFDLVLFLHGGPGLNAGIERAWFQRRLPIHWWDQPVVLPGSTDPLGQLVAASQNQVRRMADAAGGPVSLVAHSFGAQIAIALAREIPSLIQCITLLGCAPTPFQPIFRLCRKLLKTQASPTLEASLANAEADLNSHHFKAMVLAAATHPAYLPVHFGSDSNTVRDLFMAPFASGRLMNLETFLTVMNDLLGTPQQAQNQAQNERFDGEVRLVLGCQDPLLDRDEDIAAWRRVFPQLQHQVVDCGHFVHLELGPEVWWPGAVLSG